jgi:hypothetical protein
MTVSEEQGGGWKFSHLLLPITVTAFLIRVLSTFYKGWYWIDVAVGLTQLVCLILMLKHSRNLCIWCINRVPDDAPVRANGNRKPLLWAHHYIFSNLWFLGVWIVWSAFIAPEIREYFYGETEIGDIPGRWIYLPGSFLVVVMVYCWITHHRLGPWCPYCKGWEEGGEHEHTPVPDPSMLKTV